MSSEGKKKLLKGLLRYRADPSSDAYHKFHKKATDARIRLPSRDWLFPDPVAADDGASASSPPSSPPQPEGGLGGGGVQPADPDASRVAAERERERIKKAKQRAKKKQKASPQLGANSPETPARVAAAAGKMARRDAHEFKEILGSTPRFNACVAQVVKTSNAATILREVANKRRRKGGDSDNVARALFQNVAEFAGGGAPIPHRLATQRKWPTGRATQIACPPSAFLMAVIVRTMKSPKATLGISDKRSRSWTLGFPRMPILMTIQPVG